MSSWQTMRVRSPGGTPAVYKVHESMTHGPEAEGRGSTYHRCQQQHGVTYGGGCHGCIYGAPRSYAPHQPPQSATPNIVFVNSNDNTADVSESSDEEDPPPPVKVEPPTPPVKEEPPAEEKSPVKEEPPAEEEGKPDEENPPPTAPLSPSNSKPLEPEEKTPCCSRITPGFIVFGIILAILLAIGLAIGSVFIMKSFENQSSNKGIENQDPTNGEEASTTTANVTTETDIQWRNWTASPYEAIVGEAAGDQFAYAVALSGDGMIMAMRARYNNNNGTNDDNKAYSGQVRVYHRENSTSTWSPLGTPIYGEAAGDYLGWSLALSTDGKTIGIGDHSNDGGGARSGQVKVYGWDESTLDYKQRGQTIGGWALGDYFGYSLALTGDGNILAVGAPGLWEDEDRPGHVEVYKWHARGSSWKRKDFIEGETKGDEFGRSISLSADGAILAIGAPYSNRNGTSASGMVNVYEQVEASSQYEQIGRSIVGESADEFFGEAVDLSADGKTLAISAPWYGSHVGFVKVYEWDEVSPNYTQMGQTIIGKAWNDYFGWSLSISADGNDLAIGAPGFHEENRQGYVSVYSWDIEGSSWEALGETITGENGTEFGFSVDLSSDGMNLAIGAPFNENNSTKKTGEVKVFGLELI